MKVGTDAVLLATLPKFTNVNSVLDIGTGTGVLSLMLAQQFPSASITAIELDEHYYKKAIKRIDQKLSQGTMSFEGCW